jgi:flavin-binding protein dodecin
VSVFGAESSRGYDCAVRLGLQRARDMVGDDLLSVEKYTVTDRRHEIEADGQQYYTVGLNVHFQVEDRRE